MKTVVIDADFRESEKLEQFVLELEEKLEIRSQIYNVRVFTHHEDAYAYVKWHKEALAAYFVHVKDAAELDALKTLQLLKTQAVFMVYTDESALERDLLALTISELWTLATPESDEELRKMVAKVLAFAFTDRIKMVEVGRTALNIDNLLFVEAVKAHPNYLHVVLRDNECLVRATVKEVEALSPDLVKLGRSLIVNKNNLRRVEADGLTLCFDGTTRKVLAPKVAKRVVSTFGL